jgi:hypothetical protein
MVLPDARLSVHRPVPQLLTIINLSSGSPEQSLDLCRTLAYISKGGIGMATMGAAVFGEKNRIVLEDKPVPEVGPLAGAGRSSSR